MARVYAMSKKEGLVLLYSDNNFTPSGIHFVVLLSFCIISALSYYRSMLCCSYYFPIPFHISYSPVMILVIFNFLLLNILTCQVFPRVYRLIIMLSSMQLTLCLCDFRRRFVKYILLIVL